MTALFDPILMCPPLIKRLMSASILASVAPRPMSAVRCLTRVTFRFGRLLVFFFQVRQGPGKGFRRGEGLLRGLNRGDGLVRLRRHGKGEGREIPVALRFDLPTAEMFDHRIEALILRNDVEIGSRVFLHRPAEVVGQGEVQGVLARAAQSDEFDRRGILQKRFHQLHGKLRLLRPPRREERGMLTYEQARVWFG